MNILGAVILAFSSLLHSAYQRWTTSAPFVIRQTLLLGVLVLILLRRIFAVCVVLGCVLNTVYAEDISLSPKYGASQKNEAQRAADTQFISTIDEYYKGDMKKAAEELAIKGWGLLRQGDISNAMRRFNQSWLVDKANGKALWGMAVIQANTGKPTEAMKLFAEADSTIGEDLDFASDYAKAIGVTGVSTKNVALVDDAFRRFSRVYERAPQHVANLQNWAITLYFVGNYSESWKKIQLAEASPRVSEIDKKFVAALESKLPRP